MTVCVIRTLKPACTITVRFRWVRVFDGRSHTDRAAPPLLIALLWQKGASDKRGIS